MIMEKEVTANELDIKFMSPLVVRSRIDRKDYYYSFNDQDFLDTLKNEYKRTIKNYKYFNRDCRWL